MKEKRSPREPEAVWKEKDMAGGRPVDAMVVILRTNGCCWAKTGGCSMCGYRQASLGGVTEEDLNKQLDSALSAYKDEPFVKIYTSGSFLDECEIPLSIRERAFREFEGCERILFESRPEFVTEDVVKTLPRNATVALGLESSDPAVLERSINKGFTPDDVRRAGNLVKKEGLSVRTYLILKPPFLSESEAIADAVSSALFADAFSDEISVNPLNVQRGTLTERLWKNGELRSPWIWSLFDVMERLSGNVSARLMSYPSGGGSQRGVHNCGACDASALEAMEKFSSSGNLADLRVTCKCKNAWTRYMEAERLLGTAADIDRGLNNELMIQRRSDG
ncbi:MAG: archaeosine biosynthesis radical SAM protein RaSEA [Candidatus Methanoplasma sp.]|nr:archaeosine biosynthesis radical SAM protein RaSEA [Candidatus Methanoplasma sp.]